MKIKPVILCGGSGTRLWPKSKNNIAKQFIDFGGWTLLQKTIQRIKNPLFDYPIISTNLSYLKLVRKYLKKNKIKKYKIKLEPFKKNTAAAILSSALLQEVIFNQPMIFIPADHLIEKTKQFNKLINMNKKYLNDDNILNEKVVMLAKESIKNVPKFSKGIFSEATASKYSLFEES